MYERHPLLGEQFGMLPWTEIPTLRPPEAGGMYHYTLYHNTKRTKRDGTMSATNWHQAQGSTLLEALPSRLRRDCTTVENLRCPRPPEYADVSPVSSRSGTTKLAHQAFAE